jgi:hypothetical protein
VIKQLPSNNRLIARLFTRPIFTGIAKADNWRAPLNFLFENNLVNEYELKTAPLSQFFENAWKVLTSNYRNEYVYKNELANRLIFELHTPKKASFQVELPIGRSIVDVAIANGTSTAYEIKSEFDTTKRIHSQTSNYLKVFDRVYVVTHPQHIEKFEQEIDERVGLIALSLDGLLINVRDAESNLKNIEPTAVFRCLRRREYVSAIKQHMGVEQFLPSGKIANFYEKIFEEITPQLAHVIFTDALRERTTTEPIVDFVNKLPSSLRAMGYATPLSGKQRSNLLSNLSAEVNLSFAK